MGSAQRLGDTIWITIDYVCESDFDDLDHDQPPVSTPDDVGSTDEHDEWWSMTQLALVFSMDVPMVMQD